MSLRQFTRKSSMEIDSSNDLDVDYDDLQWDRLELLLRNTLMDFT
jgi:hypothetical protein